MKIILKSNVLVEYVEFKMLKTEKKELRKKLEEFYKLASKRYKMERKEIH